MMARMMMFLTLAFTSVAVDAQREIPSTDCRPGWIYFRGSCYAFADVPLAWWDAASMCEANGGHLVEIESAEENRWLVTRLRSSNYGSVWIGSSESLHRGTFVWGHSGRTLTFADWSAIDHQPADPPGIIEDCVEIRMQFGYTWNDNQCAIGNRYVCESTYANAPASSDDKCKAYPDSYGSGCIVCTAETEHDYMFCTTNIAVNVSVVGFLLNGQDAYI